MDKNNISKVATNLEKTVLRDAEMQAAQIIKQAKANEKAAIDKAEREAKILAAQYLTNHKAQISAEYSNLVTEREADCKTKLIRKRMEIESKIYDALFNRVSNFAKSEDYVHFMEVNITKIDKDSLSECVTVYISKNNIDQEIAKKHFSDFDIKISDDIVLGGIKLCDNINGIVYDMTLDLRFKESMTDFLTVSELKIPERF